MRTYPLTPQQFSALRTKLLELGISLPAESTGLLSYQGITLGYSYDGQTLTLTEGKKPFFAPWSLIWDKVDEWLKLASS